MRASLSRRDLILSAPGLLAAGAALGAFPSRAFAEDAPAASADPVRWPGFPRQEIENVRGVVGASHFDEQKVRELVDATPELVNAWWDWGFGDWESPLGAASHVGRRSIAEFLIERGARIDIFAAAMLGMTDIVKGFIAARPGIQRTLGPHGIPLLAHARAGGEEAAETLAYLETVDGAGNGIEIVPLADERKPAYLGEYAVSDAAGQRVVVTMNKDGLLNMDMNDDVGYKVSRRIHHRGNDEFYPAGAPSVRVRFAMENDQARALTIFDRRTLLVANRI